MAFGDETREWLERKKAGLYALLLNWGGILESYAKTHARWKDRTGHARQAIHGGVDRKGGEYTLYVAHGVRYGIWLEEGTAPHEIRPKRKKALYWKGASHPVKRVMHPGSKSYAILKPTAEMHLPRIRKTVTDYWGD